MLLGVTSYDWLFFNLPFLGKQNQQLCQFQGDETWTTRNCTTENICANLKTIKFKPDVDDSRYIDNWQNSMDLICKSPREIGLIGQMYFIGLIMGLPFLTTLSDKYGRKPIFLFTIFTNMLCQYIIFFTSNFVLTLFCLFVEGVLWSGQNVVGMQYLDEILPSRYKEDIFTIMFIAGSSISLLIPLNYMLISSSFIGLSLIGLATITVACLGVPWYIPESPKWLYSKGRYDEAREVFYRIAAVNSVVLTSDIRFDKEEEGQLRIAREYEKISLTKVSSIFSDEVSKRNVIILMIQWTVGSVVNYIISFRIAKLHGDMFYNAVSIAVAHIIGQLCCNYFIKKMGTRATFKSMESLTLLATICIMYIQSGHHQDEDHSNPKSTLLMAALLLLAGFGYNDSLLELLHIDLHRLPNPRARQRNEVVQPGLSPPDYSSSSNCPTSKAVGFVNYCCALERSDRKCLFS